jgi:hypothetical protein
MKYFKECDESEAEFELMRSQAQKIRANTLPSAEEV